MTCSLPFLFANYIYKNFVYFCYLDTNVIPFSELPNNLVNIFSLRKVEINFVINIFCL